MIDFKKITDDNFSRCIKLNPGEEGKKFVADNVISLAEAYLTTDKDTIEAMPYAIYEDDKMVGFIMMAFVREEHDEDLTEDCYDLWRFMIDQEFQGKGFGRAALNKAIDLIKTFPYGMANKLYLSYVPGNNTGSSLYESVGFKATGEVDEGEIVMALDLTV